MTSRRRSTLVATQALELALAVPQVVAHRLAAMSSAGFTPSAGHRREIHLMGTEKIAAFYESWHAMVVEMTRAYFELWTSPYSWMSRPGHSSARARRTALAVLGSGLAPIHRRAVANAKRLGRVRAR